MHYFYTLIQISELNNSYKTKFITFFNNNAVTLWTSGCYQDYLLFGAAWNEPAVGNSQLTAQTNACMTIEVKALFSKVN